MKTTELIQEYKNLYDEGTLTAEEYNYLKSYLLQQGDKQYEEDGDVLNASRKAVKEERGNNLANGIRIVLGVAIILGICVLLFKGCTWLLSDEEKDKDSDVGGTYYIDDNKNGEFDEGEANFTLDDDGNIIDPGENRKDSK